MSPPLLRNVAVDAGTPARPQPTGKARRPLGQILVETGGLSASDKLRTLAMQAEVEARLGDILLAHRLIDKTRLYDAIARQYNTDVADFRSIPPDIRLIETLGVETCLSTGLLPWQRRAGIVLVASARPEEFAAAQPRLELLFGPVRMVIASENDIHQAVLGKHPRILSAKAETRVAAEDSCREWPSLMLPYLMLGLFTALILSAALAPQTAFLVLAGWTLLTLVAGSLLKLAALTRRVLDDLAGHDGAMQNPPVIARLPTVSILVPLYREREIADRLIRRLARLDYPRELLDICLVVEADDQVTCNAIGDIDLPPHVRQIVVPHSALKTKPRALNYALEFCRGTIIGVYDAEDAPAPDQIDRVVRRFHQVGQDVACLQGVLDFYNARSNWFSRCFTVEYASWFRVILPGLARLGLVVPLGGTTLFFRRQVLEELGGWDAHNVTEDADLGLRLARRGYRTELIDTVTEEEANCRFWPWVKQRSRWLKGYAITWAVHMRAPRKLWSELGPWRFFGVQVLFLGTLTQTMLAPVLWSFWLVQLGLAHPFHELAPPLLIGTVIAAFILSELLNIAIGLYATRAPKHRFLMKWVPSLYFYFPMAALASYKGALELLTRPFYWDKTTHGVFDSDNDPAADGDAAVRPTPRPLRRRA
ncbi:MAG: glycosyltransferase [Rhodobacteraceae bacterium]|nr:glycosyltransferase [Paracoccaceae bacterium]